MEEKTENGDVQFTIMENKDWVERWDAAQIGFHNTLASQGYTVFGVELAEKALQDFFQENDIPFTTEAAPSVDGIIFKSDDGRIILYCCDLFRISNDVVGQFDIIWDRGSLVAINREDREKYAALIKSLMAPGCKYLACTVEYDETKHKGPPHNVTDDAMQKLYGDTCEVTKADREDAIEDKHREWGLTSFFENLYVVEQKHS
ncbi:hypothetical protein C0Q70_16454 [Pomacea canaliculata]|uniref:thiopurine S-methyltransferase n=1 Tax=Pomacea canaliculata TaxID=400727 RepID=A0A2T7NPU4_POMCA|nr:hypothetical protein C0Q70_16454 [Pomacea canaliculata]